MGANCCSDSDACTSFALNASASGVSLAGAVVGLGVAAVATGGTALVAAGIAAGIGATAGSGFWVVDAFKKPMCGVDNMVFFGEGSCQGNPLVTVQNLLQAECNTRCLNFAGCSFASHNTVNERCKLFGSACAPNSDSEYETFRLDANAARRIEHRLIESESEMGSEF